MQPTPHASSRVIVSRDGIFKSSTNAVLATAIFRCWHILIFFTAWAAAITIISAKGYKVSVQSTLLTVLGTVLGFVISYRTSTSYERYNEGRKYWSQIILASRTLSRLVWIHVPELPLQSLEDQGWSEDERRARTIIEKKTVINLIEAFSVAVKHYLRGEEGINYVDLYHLVKFLPSYPLPEGIARSAGEQFEGSSSNLARTTSLSRSHRPQYDNNLDVPFDLTDQGREIRFSESLADADLTASVDASGGVGAATSLELPLPATTKRGRPGTNNAHSRKSALGSAGGSVKGECDAEDVSSNMQRPAAQVPKSSLQRLFARLFHWQKKDEVDFEHRFVNPIVRTRNVPLEISLYLNSYVAHLQFRKSIDAPAATLFVNAITQLVDALTGLERILTTPIPFSYSTHLWIVTILYVFVLPFQIVGTMGWVTIPATTLMSFIFFGFLVAGEEIENPFGYDRNDLNMDHFTHNIIRNELRALTAYPPPDPGQWAFHPRNDCLFVTESALDDRGFPPEHTSPSVWVQRGARDMNAVLAAY